MKRFIVVKRLYDNGAINEYGTDIDNIKRFHQSHTIPNGYKGDTCMLQFHDGVYFNTAHSAAEILAKIEGKKPDGQPEMVAAGFTYGAVQSPHAFLQWKGTEACFDFKCECGALCHYDGYFAYTVKCPHCMTVYEMPFILYPRKVCDESNPEWRKDPKILYPDEEFGPDDVAEGCERVRFLLDYQVTHFQDHPLGDHDLASRCEAKYGPGKLAKTKNEATDETDLWWEVEMKDAEDDHGQQG